MMLVVIGYLLHDVLDIDGKLTESPGGTATYTSLAAKKLGMSVGIVSKVGKDYKYHRLLKGIDVSGVGLQEKTTTFFDTIRNSRRRERVANIGEKLLAKDFPDKFLDADAIHIGPVIDEIDFDLVKYVRENSSALITMDIQGFVRKSVNGKVVPKKFDFSALKHADAIHCSEDDLAGTGIRPGHLAKKCKLVILTNGYKGSIIIGENKSIQIPAFKTKTTDITGAGDTYMAGFVKKFLQSNDVKESGIFGGAVASFCVEGLGISGLKDEKHVIKRIEKGERNLL